MAVFALASEFLGDSIASLEIEMLSGLGKNCLCLQGESLVHILQIDKRRKGALPSVQMVVVLPAV